MVYLSAVTEMSLETKASRKSKVARFKALRFRFWGAHFGVKMVQVAALLYFPKGPSRYIVYT